MYTVDYLYYQGQPVRATVHYGAPPAIMLKKTTPQSSAHPDGSLIAYVGTDKNIWVTHPDGSGKLQLTHANPSGPGFDSPRWSFDGRMLTFNGPKGVAIYEHNRLSYLPPIPQCPWPYNPTFLPDNHRIIFICRQSFQTPGTLPAIVSSNVDGSQPLVLIDYAPRGTKPFGSLSLGGAPTSIIFSRLDKTMLINLQQPQNTLGAGFIGLANTDGSNLHILPRPSMYRSIWHGTFGTRGINIIAQQCQSACSIPGDKNETDAWVRINRHGTIIATLRTLPKESAVSRPSLSPNGTHITYSVHKGSGIPAVVVSALPNGPTSVIAAGSAPNWQPVSGQSLSSTGPRTTPIPSTPHLTLREIQQSVTSFVGSPPTHVVVLPRSTDNVVRVAALMNPNQWCVSYCLVTIALPSTSPMSLISKANVGAFCNNVDSASITARGTKVLVDCLLGNLVVPWRGSFNQNNGVLTCDRIDIFIGGKPGNEHFDCSLTDVSTQKG